MVRLNKCGYGYGYGYGFRFNFGKGLLNGLVWVRVETGESDGGYSRWLLNRLAVATDRTEEGRETVDCRGRKPNSFRDVTFKNWFILRI